MDYSDKRMMQIALSDPQLLRELNDSSLFDTLDEDYQKYSLRFNQYYDKFNVLPNMDNAPEKIRNIFDGAEVTDADKEHFRYEINTLEKQELKYKLLEKLEKEEDGITHSDIMHILENSRKVDDGDFDEITTIRSNHPEDIEQVFELWKEEDEGSFSTGLFGLNSLLNGGWAPSRTYAFQGPTGAGKSIWLMNVARLAAYEKNKKVLFITLEMTKGDQIERLYRAQYECKSREEVVAHYRGGHIKSLEKGYIHFIDKISMSSNDLEVIVEERLAEKPDLIVIDYIKPMKVNARKQPEVLWERMSQISEELEATAKRLEVPIVTAYQANRSAINNDTGKQKDVSSLSHAGGSFDMLHKFSNVLSIWRDEINEPSVYRLESLKSRHGKNRQIRGFTFNQKTLAINDVKPEEREIEKEPKSSGLKGHVDVNTKENKELAKKQGMRTL